MALGANWRFADKPTLRIFMHRFCDLESQALPGPVRSRFRARRLALVEFCRRHLGLLGDDRPGVGRHINRRRFVRPHYRPTPPVQRIYGHLLFSSEAL
jgi:hypothetical protein